MTANQAHILFDSLLREINKEVNMNIIPEVKDIYLNSAALLSIKEAARQERDRIHNVAAYANKGDYYALLAPFTKEIDLPLLVGDGRYNYADLPAPSTSLSSKGLFRNKHSYLVGSETSDYNLSNLTSDTFPITLYLNQVFTVNIPDININGSTGNGGGNGGNPTDKTVSVNKLVKGNVYKIVKCVGFNFITFGAVSNSQGTLFVANQDVNLPNTFGVIIHLEVYAAAPISYGIPRLKAQPITSDDYAEPLLFSALVNIRPPFNSGSLVKGKRYKLHAVGTTNLTIFGLSANTENSVFVCKVSGTPEWGASPCSLVEVDFKGCELIKPVDLESKLTHAFGTTISRPIVTIIDNQLRVYHLGNFEVSKVLMTYVRVPNIINYQLNNEMEFNAIEQIEVIQKAVRLAGSSLASENYQTLKIETDKGIKKQQN